MIIKRFLTIIISIILILLITIGSVHAVEMASPAEANKVSHRHMAIACAMAYVQPQVGQKLSTLWKNFSKVTKIINDVNSKINLNEYAEVEELDDWVVSDQLGGITGGFFSEEGMYIFILSLIYSPTPIPP